MAQLVFLPDAELWRVAQSKLTVEESERMHELMSTRQRVGLSTPEESEAEGLLYRYDRNMLLRAQSAALLKERGHDGATFERPELLDSGRSFVTG